MPRWRLAFATRLVHLTAMTDDELLDAVLGHIAAVGWRRWSYPALATATGASLSDLRRVFPTPGAVLCRLMARADQVVLAGTDLADPSSPRDRLFDVLMRRFDALASAKAALQAWAKDYGGDPLTVVTAASALPLSQAWMLDAARIERYGARGAVRVAALSLLYARVFRVWLDDDAADLPKTMAALDQALKRAGSLLIPTTP